MLRAHDEDQLSSTPGQTSTPTATLGNRRTASLLFLDYFRLNGAFLASDGRPRFSDTALVALALLVATSDPKDKDIIIRLILNLPAEDRP